MLDGRCKLKYSRHDEVLKLIVEDFIDSAQPIGSEALIQKHNLNCSSATIRNVMATLEEEGLIEKTHTSSGRVPSKKGYAYYLENLQYDSDELDNLEEELQNHFKLALQSKNKSIEDVMEQSCKVLSEITNLATVVLGPKASDEKLISLQLVRVNQEAVTAILVTDQGYVENKTFILPSNLNVKNVQDCVSMLNERLIGTPISEIDEKAEKIAPILVKKLGKEATIVVQAFKEAIMMFTKNRLSSFGTRKLLELPEFKESSDEITKIIDYFQNEDRLVGALQEMDDKAEVKINLPTNEDDEQDIAIVSKEVEMPNRNSAKIAVVGPKRMDYKKVTKALEILTKILDHYFNNEGEEDEET